MRKCFEVNVYQLFWFAQAFLPMLLQADKPLAARTMKKIVTVASSAGMGGNPRLVDYCSSKFAAMGFGESLQIELAAREADSYIQTSLVCPFFINTGMFDGTSPGNALSRLVGMVMLEEGYVVDKILNECILGSVDHLCVPKLIYLVPIMKALFPHKIRIFLSNALGAFKAMDTFRGSRSAVQNVASGAIADRVEAEGVLAANARLADAPDSPVKR